MKRARLIKPLKQEPAIVQAPTPINDDPRPDANFTGTLEEWDDRVFLHAVKFRVHRFSTGGNASTEVDDFAQAMRLAIDTLRAGMRVIVYAVTESGRHQALDKKRWEHYAKLYNNQGRK